jgi:hypothetical protein
MIGVVEEEITVGVALEDKALADVVAAAEIVKCTEPSAVTAERIVKYLSDQPEPNLYIVVNALRKWVADPTREGSRTEVPEEIIIRHKVLQNLKITNN